MDALERQKSLPDFITKEILCADAVDEIEGTCNGDSGAGLYEIQDKSYPNFYILRGVLHGKLGGCGDPTYPSLFADVTSPKIWNFIKGHAFMLVEEDQDSIGNSEIALISLVGICLSLFACILLGYFYRNSRQGQDDDNVRPTSFTMRTFSEVDGRRNSTKRFKLFGN